MKRLPLFALASLLCAAPAAAVGPGDLCTGDPCVVTGTVAIDAAGTGDYGTATLRLARGARLLLNPGIGPVTLSAAELVIEPGARVRALGPGANLQLQTTAGDITIGSQTRRARLDLRGATLVDLSAEGDVFLNAVLDAKDASEVVIDGSAVTVRGRIKLDASGDGFAGDLAISGDSLDLDAPIRARGGIGGIIELSAAFGPMVVASSIVANGRGEVCQGGEIVIDTDTSLELTGRIDVAGRGRECFGGLAEVFSAGSLTATGRVSARSAGGLSFGGMIEMVGWGPTLIRGANTSGGTGGDILLDGETLELQGLITAQSSGAGFFNEDGSIELSADCGVTVPAGARVDARRGFGFFGISIDSGGPVQIGGRVLSSTDVEILHPTGSPPVITGVVQPAPILVERAPHPTCP